jgi:uridine kinase
LKTPFLIAVSGGSGSGKSTLVKLIQEASASDILILSQDHYYRDLSHLSKEERDQVNFDNPNSIDDALLLSHLKLLLQNKAIERPIYDFASHTRVPNKTIQVEPRPTIVLDGIFSLAFEEIRKLVQLKIFMETGDDLRFIRRLKRDMEERGRSLDSVIKQYCETVRPMHIQHIESTKRFADLVVFWEDYNYQSVNMIVSLIKQYHSKQ